MCKQSRASHLRSYLVMEHIEGISLLSHLKSKNGRKLAEEEARRLFRHIMRAVCYIHGKNVTHRDIKLENLLLTPQRIVKLIDFGFSACVPPEKRLKIFCGTPSYMAPEIVQKKEYLGAPADIWACVILLFAMLCGQFPFRSSTDKDLYRKITKGLFNVPEHVSFSGKRLICRILEVDPSKRPSAEDILRDQWFRE